ncbi:dioxygenase [Streptomyces pinistramenti]|uniref:dioxygenase n=1 Tax=Streptomyces pinistramenti TaxID=2884812 RepID=UPI00222311D0|nr:dioxygenase [Streptomyces pinistramenti]
MAIDLTAASITEAVRKAFEGAEDERVKELFVRPVQHLHDFTREVRLTGEEWCKVMDFLERVGKTCTPTRQEFVLLSDLLGLSVLVDLIHHPGGGSATDSTLLGPFYVEGRPTAENGSLCRAPPAGQPPLRARPVQAASPRADLRPRSWPGRLSRSGGEESARPGRHPALRRRKAVPTRGCLGLRGPAAARNPAGAPPEQSGPADAHPADPPDQVAADHIQRPTPHKVADITSARDERHGARDSQEEFR